MSLKCCSSICETIKLVMRLGPGMTGNHMPLAFAHTPRCAYEIFTESQRTIPLKSIAGWCSSRICTKRQPRADGHLVPRYENLSSQPIDSDYLCPKARRLLGQAGRERASNMSSGRETGQGSSTADEAAPTPNEPNERDEKDPSGRTC